MTSRIVLGRIIKFLPIVERELRVAARGQAVYRWRIAVGITALALIALLSLTLVAQGSLPEVHGRTLFHTLLGVSAIYAFLGGVSVTADSISREKREGTLGLLFLTALRGMDIILR